MTIEHMKICYNLFDIIELPDNVKRETSSIDEEIYQFLKYENKNWDKLNRSVENN